MRYVSVVPLPGWLTSPHLPLQRVGLAWPCIGGHVRSAHELPLLVCSYRLVMVIEAG